MNKKQKDVWNWQEKVGLSEENNKELPGIPEDITRALFRYRLIEEESNELRKAIIDGNLTEIADALGDILFVTYGAANHFGIDLEPVFEEILKSNLTKVGAKKDKNGKLLKGNNFKLPDLETILANQKKLVDLV